MGKTNKQAVAAVHQQVTLPATVEQLPRRRKDNDKKAVEPFWQKFTIAIVAIVPAFFSGATVGSRYRTPVEPSPTPAPVVNVQPSPLVGRPLATYENYPIVADQTGALRLDPILFGKCVRQVLENNDQKAAADLLYLGEQNHVTLTLSPDSRVDYQQLRNRFNLREFNDVNRQKDEIFEVYKDIVNGIGQTFAGIPFEIVLHDTRNPLHSIVAIQNAISGRKLRDPTTNFGIQLIKEYSSKNEHMASYISYRLKLKNGREIKSTTIPLYHSKYGLIGFVCINIDTSQLKHERANLPDGFIKRFVEQFTATDVNQRINELLENSRQK